MFMDGVSREMHTVGGCLQKALLLKFVVMMCICCYRDSCSFVNVTVYSDCFCCVHFEF